MKQTLQAFSVKPLNPTGTAPTARLAADVPFQASTGEVHPAGDDQRNYTEYALTVAGDGWTFPSSIIDTTNDSSDPNATYTLFIMNGNKLIETVFERWTFDASLGVAITFQELLNDNQVKVPYTEESYSKTQVNALIEGRSFANPSSYATALNVGITRLSVDPIAAPIAAGDNDPRLAAATTTNRGTVILATSGETTAGEAVQANDPRINSDVYNVKDYGAVGDGVTNDAAAIQDTLNAAGALVATKARVYFPAGKYRIATAISKSFSGLQQQLTIEGDGSASQIIFNVGVAGSALTLSNINFIRIHNLTFTGPAVAAENYRGLIFNTVLQAVIENCHFYGLHSMTSANGGAIYALVSRLRIVNSSFRGCSGSSVVGTGIIGAENWRDVDLENIEFLDFGTINGVFHTLLGAADGWVRLGNVQPDIGVTLAGGHARFVNISSDEGAAVSLRAISATTKISSIVIDQWKANNGITGGFYITNAKNVSVKDSYVGYNVSTALDDSPAIQTVDVDNVYIKNCRFKYKTDLISFRSGTLGATIEDTEYESLDRGSAAIRLIVNGQVVEDSFKASATPSVVSGQSKGIVYQDSTSGKLRASLNGSPYFDLHGGTVSSQLADAFPTGARDAAKWNLVGPVAGVTISQTANQLLITPTDGCADGTSGYESVNTYDFAANGNAIVHAVQSASGSSGGPSIITRLRVAAGADTYDILYRHFDNSLFFQIGGVSSVQLPLPGSPDPSYADTQWWRIYYDPVGNLVVFQTSPESVTWTTRHSGAPVSIPNLATARFSLAIVTTGVVTITDAAKFDDFGFSLSYPPMITDTGITTTIAKSGNGVQVSAAGALTAIGTGSIVPTDATLVALAAYNTNGLLTQTAADTFAGRTITGTADQVVVSNGSGVSGNPTLSLPQSIATTSSPTFAGETISATRPTLSVTFTGTTGKGRLASALANLIEMTQNLAFDGSNYNLDDTALPGWVVRAYSTGDAVNIYHATAGANPRTVSSFFEINGITGVGAFRKGADVASAGTIVPTGNVFTITGTTTISTITATNVPLGAVLYMITTSALTFDEAGNIDVTGATSLLTTANYLAIAAWDGTKWRLR